MKLVNKMNIPCFIFIALTMLLSNCTNDTLPEIFSVNSPISLAGVRMYAQQDGNILGISDKEIKEIEKRKFPSVVKDDSVFLATTTNNVHIKIRPYWKRNYLNLVDDKMNLFIRCTTSKSECIIDSLQERDLVIDSNSLQYIMIDSLGKIHIFSEESFQFINDWSILIIIQADRALIARNPLYTNTPSESDPFYRKNPTSTIIYKRVTFRKGVNGFTGVRELQGHLQN